MGVRGEAGRCRSVARRTAPGRLQVVPGQNIPGTFLPCGAGPDHRCRPPDRKRLKDTDSVARVDALRAVAWMAPAVFIILAPGRVQGGRGRARRSSGCCCSISRPSPHCLRAPPGDRRTAAPGRTVLAGGEIRLPSFSYEESLVIRGRPAEAADAFRAHLEQHPATSTRGWPWPTSSGCTSPTPRAPSGCTWRSGRGTRRPPGGAASNQLIDLYRATGQRGGLLVELARFADRYRGDPAGTGGAAPPGRDEGRRRRCRGLTGRPISANGARPDVDLAGGAAGLPGVGRVPLSRRSRLHRACSAEWISAFTSWDTSSSASSGSSSGWPAAAWPSCCCRSVRRPCCGAGADYFGVAVAGGWEALSAIELSRYVADARALELDLVSFGESAIHDWNYLLGRLGCCPRTWPSPMPCGSAPSCSCSPRSPPGLDVPRNGPARQGPLPFREVAAVPFGRRAVGAVDRQRDWRRKRSARTRRRSCCRAADGRPRSGARSPPPRWSGRRGRPDRPRGIRGTLPAPRSPAVTAAAPCRPSGPGPVSPASPGS